MLRNNRQYQAKINVVIYGLTVLIDIALIYINLNDADFKRMTQDQKNEKIMHLVSILSFILPEFIIRPHVEMSFFAYQQAKAFYRHPQQYTQNVMNEIQKVAETLAQLLVRGSLSIANIFQDIENQINQIVNDDNARRDFMMTNPLAYFLLVSITEPGAGYTIINDLLSTPPAQTYLQQFTTFAGNVARKVQDFVIGNPGAVLDKFDLKM